jgi:NAD+ kinase
VVLGGDGFMLRILHEYMHLNIPFFGINCGTVGFLMNEIKPENLLKRINATTCTNIHPLSMNAVDVNGENINALAINEIYLFRQSNQIIKIKVIIDNITRIENLSADGVIVSTSAGSSAYNCAVGGPILPIGSNILSLYAISPFRPRKWRGALLPHNVKIEFIASEYHKRPVNIVADFNEFKNIVSAKVVEDTSINIMLLFDAGHGLEDRIIREQFI